MALHSTLRIFALYIANLRALRHIISITVWVLIVLIAVFMTLMEIPSVQTAMGNGVSSALSNMLDTRVGVGKVRMTFPLRITVDDFVVYDKSNKEMIRSNRLAAGIALKHLAEGRVSIHSAQLFGASFNLYQDSIGAPANFQFVIDALSSNDTTSKSNLDLHIGSLIVRRSSVKFDRHDAAATPGRFNANHIHATDISGHFRLRSLTNDSINVEVKKLSLKEHSGLRLERLALNLVSGHTATRLSGFTLRLPQSSITISDISATHTASKLFGIDPASLDISGRIDNVKVAASDFAFLQPSLSNSNASITMSASIDGNGSGVNLNGIAATAMLPGSAVETVSVNGDAGIHRGNGIWADLAAATSIGDMACEVSISPDSAFNGNVSCATVDLGQLTADQRLGNVSATLGFNGAVSKGTLSDIEANGEIAEFVYDGYKLTANNLTLGYTSGNRPHVVVKGEISGYIPAHTTLPKKWADGNFSVDIDTDIRTSLTARRQRNVTRNAIADIIPSRIAVAMDNAVGHISASNLHIASAADTLHLSRLAIHSGFDEGKHFMLLKSDMAEGRLVGSTTSDFILGADIKPGDIIGRLAGIPLSIGVQSALFAKTDANDSNMYASVDLPAFSFSGTDYRNGSINFASHRGAINCTVGVDQLTGDGGRRQLRARGHTMEDSKDRLVASLKWGHTINKDEFSGEVNALIHSSLGDESEDGGSDESEDGVDGNDAPKTIMAELRPSHLRINGDTWQLNPATIIYCPASTDSDTGMKVPMGVDIRDFSLSHANQQLRVNGTVSDSPHDSLHVSLRNIDVAYVLDLVKFRSVSFDGKASGSAYIKTPMSDFTAEAKLMVNGFKFQDGGMGVLDAGVEWNKEQRRIDINAVADGGPRAMTYINGYVSPSPGYIDLNVHADGTSLEFIQSFTKSFLGDVGGSIHGDVRVIGPLSAINLTGRAAIRDAGFSVTALNTHYRLTVDSVYLTHNKIEIREASILDKRDMGGTVTGVLSHRNLGRFSYDLTANFDNMLAYDHREFGTNTFHGTIYATGSTEIKGKPGELTINVNATPQRGSTFTYNVAGQSTVANREFIRWNDATPQPPYSAAAARPQETPKHNIGSDMYLNFIINSTPDATIRLLMNSSTDDYITLNGRGTLTANYHNKGAFNMFGTYTVDRGTYDITIQDILRKKFAFGSGGTIQFGGDPFHATLNLQASHTVNGVSLADLNMGNSYSAGTTKVNCLMNITGQPLQPQVSFDIDLPTASNDERQMLRSVLSSEDELNQQVVYLLAIGRFLPQSNNANSAGRQQSQTALAMQSLLSSTISGHISNILNNVIKNDDWSFGANISTGNEGWENAEYEGLLSGRLLSGRLLFNGQFGYRDNAETDNSSFVGDFELQYLLTPDGGLAIKVYNQSNDRYFTKSSLVTQGIGLIMKRDFTDALDFFGIKRRGNNNNKR